MSVKLSAKFSFTTWLALQDFHFFLAICLINHCPDGLAHSLNSCRKNTYCMWSNRLVKSLPLGSRIDNINDLRFPFMLEYSSVLMIRVWLTKKIMALVINRAKKKAQIPAKSNNYFYHMTLQIPVTGILEKTCHWIKSANKVWLAFAVLCLFGRGWGWGRDSSGLITSSVQVDLSPQRPSGFSFCWSCWYKIY